MASYYEAARKMEAIDWQKRVTYYLKTCFIFNYQLMKVLANIVTAQIKKVVTKNF